MSETVNKSKLKYQLKSFRWAFNGLSEFFRSETKATIHLIAALIAICLGILFKISYIEWALITSAIGIVFIAEIINTALEHTAETIPDEFDQKRKSIKDLGAAAVLFASITALIVGLLIVIN